MPLPPVPPASSPDATRVYTLLVFDELMPTPWAVILDAEDDADAVKLAQAHHPTKRRELWHKHRLVVAIG